MVRKRSNSLGELDSPFNAVGSLMRHMNSVLNINKPKYDPVIEDRKPTMQELLDSEEKTIKILLELADDLDKVYRDCQISYAVSKGAALAGNIITFAGAISATVTFGVTLPLVITGRVKPDIRQYNLLYYTTKIPFNKRSQEFFLKFLILDNNN